jgi:hypothetical protein
VDNTIDLNKVSFVEDLQLSFIHGGSQLSKRTNDNNYDRINASDFLGEINDKNNNQVLDSLANLDHTINKNNNNKSDFISPREIILKNDGKDSLKKKISLTPKFIHDKK